MSGSNNVVAMPKPGSPMPAPAAAPGQQLWPMNPVYPIPPGPWNMPGGYPAGCCPPGGMDALLKCYCDIQAATAFISKVVTDLAANDPAFQQALVDAIAASGSNIPLIGVTNGSEAQPGQVGEFWAGGGNWNFPSGNNTSVLQAGVLQPGDWNVWTWVNSSVSFDSCWFSQSPVPTGFLNGMAAGFGSPGGAFVEQTTILSPTVQATISVPSLIVFNLSMGAPTAGTLYLSTWARRMR